MQPGCGAAYPTMIRESHPVDQADDVGTRQIEGTEPGRSSVPALVMLQHIQKRTGIKEQMLDTGLSSTIRLQCMYWNCRAVPWNVLEEMMPSPFTLLSEIVIVLPPSETDSTTPT